MIWVFASLALLLLVVLGWGVFEAGWPRLMELEVPIPGLPEELDGLRIAHIGDLHLGARSHGHRAVADAIAWVRERKPDLVLVSGDLLSRPRGEAELRRLLGKLDNCFVVLGNHDYALSRDPFSRPSAVHELEPAALLFDEAREIEIRGKRLQIVGVDPRSYHARRAAPQLLADPEAELRICLSHFPGIAERMPERSFDLICAGHLHDGQIALPYPGGKLRFAHPRERHGRGLMQYPSGLLHLSPGLGTTFLPFRIFARPEATELHLRCAPRPRAHTEISS
jgi:predicted MPP superfamily phosphohydrolase